MWWTGRGCDHKNQTKKKTNQKKKEPLAPWLQWLIDVQLFPFLNLEVDVSGMQPQA